MMGQTTSSLSSPSSPEHIIFDFDRDITVTRQQRFKHPTAAFFHIIFKLVSIILYLFGGLFGQDFLSIFVLLILLISFDFWTVKNVTGRLLVGLRWWNTIDDEGRSHWIFENRHNTTDANKDDSFKASDRLSDNSADSTIFWTALIIAPILWFILLLVTVFRLNVQWFMVVSLALVLSSSNLYGYIRCKLGGNFKSVLTQYVGKQIFYNFMSSSNTKTSPNMSGYPTA